MQSNEFWDDIRNIVPLSKDETQILIQNIKDNNKNKEISKNRLITGIYKTLYTLIQNVEYDSNERMDSLQDASVILTENLESYIKTYNPNKGSFNTYINSILKNALIKSSWDRTKCKIKIDKCQKTYEKMKKAYILNRQYSHISERERVQKIAIELNVKENTICKYLSKYSELEKAINYLSLDALIFDNENSTTSLKDTLSFSVSPEELYLQEDYMNSLHESLAELLNEEELKIVEAYMYKDYLQKDYNEYNIGKITEVMTNVSIKLRENLDYDSLEIIYNLH